YVGECRECDARLEDLVAVRSAVGYSGTNAGGHLIVAGNRFEDDGAGIVPNSYDTGQVPPPQDGIVIQHNTVVGSGRMAIPVSTLLVPFVGVGIAVAGGVDDVVVTNTVTGSARYGIAVTPTRQEGRTWLPRHARVYANIVRDSGVADLAMASGSGDAVCFEANVAGSSLPARLQATCPFMGAGSERVRSDLAAPIEAV